MVRNKMYIIRLLDLRIKTYSGLGLRGVSKVS